ncbi:MAG: peptidase M50 [Verrucomicrobia bacterium]|nr:MAG: peptidase M50 [Verrucomicrobiota bacterium]
MQGAIRLFKFSGIQVYLHFSWFIIGAYQLTQRLNNYQSPIFALYEYLALFGIVLLHEFGHALACRQTGGRADHIVLWPLGGIAFVDPPRRPGAVLWSIAAGPLVNVALIPVIELLWIFAGHSEWRYDAPDTFRLIQMIRYINFGLLIFNLLPVYPLDGGQILRALLWFPLGEIRSLQIASVVGLIGGAALAVLALMSWSIWTGILAFFILSRAIAGWQYAKAMIAEKKAAEAPPLMPQV